MKPNILFVNHQERNAKAKLEGLHIVFPKGYEIFKYVSSNIKNIDAEGIIAEARKNNCQYIELDEMPVKDQVKLHELLFKDKTISIIQCVLGEDRPHSRILIS